jgi:type VI secretion system secreted protein Hcp
MKALLPTRLVLKIPLLVTTCIIILTLMVACNGLPPIAPTATEEPVKPGAEEPVKPAAEEPAKQATDEPAKPATDEPAKPATDEPVKPATEEPDEPVVDEPDKPAISEKIPGATDFTDTKQPPEGGALLGSPAVDMFLKIDGIPGESTEDKHKEWIEILSYSSGVSQPGAGAMSSGGVRSAERCDHSDFSVVKTLDKASPKLALYVCSGTHIEEIIIELCHATGDKQKYMEYKMTDVIVSSVSVSGSAGEGPLPLEEVTFAYGKIEWTYTEVDHITGKPKGDVKTHWDLTTNSGG